MNRIKELGKNSGIINGQCDGYSTVKYIVNTFNITNQNWVDASVIHPDWICYPVYSKTTATDAEGDAEYWVARVMFVGNERLVPLGICPTNVSFALPAFTFKTKDYSDIMRMYQFKN